MLCDSVSFTHLTWLDAYPTMDIDHGVLGFVYVLTAIDLIQIAIHLIDNRAKVQQAWQKRDCELNVILISTRAYLLIQ